jgi:hypothetical protein
MPASRPGFQLGAQLAHLLGESPVVAPEVGGLTPSGGHLLGERGQHAAQARQAVEQLIAFASLNSDRIDGEARRRRGARSGRRELSAGGRDGHVEVCELFVLAICLKCG